MKGTVIRINHMIVDEPRYDGVLGVVEHKDDIGQLHGSWGGVAVDPSVDDYYIVKETYEKDGVTYDVVDDGYTAVNVEYFKGAMGVTVCIRKNGSIVYGIVKAHWDPVDECLEMKDEGVDGEFKEDGVTVDGMYILDRLPDRPEHIERLYEWDYDWFIEACGKNAAMMILNITEEELSAIRSTAINFVKAHLARELTGCIKSPFKIHYYTLAEKVQERDLGNK